MHISDDILECLHIKKVGLAVEVNSFQDKIKAYIVISPIEEKREQRYKTNLLPIVSYEVRYIRHKDIYTESDWGWDYDYVLDDDCTRIKRYFIPRTENNEELEKCLELFTFDITRLRRLLPYGSFDSALVNNPIDVYIDNELTYPHLFQVDYRTK